MIDMLIRSIEVTVDKNGIPSCLPFRKSKRRGNGRLSWKLIDAGYYFENLQFVDPQPAAGIFTNMTISNDKQRMTLDDDNTGAEAPKEYEYVITIKPDNSSSDLKEVRTSAKAVIRNEP